MKRLLFLALLAGIAAAADFTTATLEELPFNANVVTNVDFTGLATTELLTGYKPLQSAKASPTIASGASRAFIDTITQDTNGVISATKRALGSASTAVDGIVQLSNATNSTSQTLAATPNAVRLVRIEVGNMAPKTRDVADVASSSVSGYNSTQGVGSPFEFQGYQRKESYEQWLWSNAGLGMGLRLEHNYSSTQWSFIFVAGDEIYHEVVEGTQTSPGGDGRMFAHDGWEWYFTPGERRVEVAYMDAFDNAALNAIQAQAVTNIGTQILDPLQDQIDRTSAVVDGWGAYWTGTNLWFEITNYQHTVAGVIPELSIKERRDGLERTVWTDAEKFDIFATNMLSSVQSRLDDTTTLIATSEVYRAWSRYLSGTGKAAPENVTWISTPETYLAAGYEWEKLVTASNTVWVLASKGHATNLTPSDDAFLSIATLDGESVLTIKKTDSYLIGVDPTNIVVTASTANSTTVRVNVPIVASTHPFARTSTDLHTWQMEEDGITNANIVWSGSSGNYVCTATFTSPAGYLYFEFLKEGETIIQNAVPVELGQGIIFNGTVYRPVVNGNKLEFIAQ